MIEKGTGGRNPLPNYPPPQIPAPRQSNEVERCRKVFLVSCETNDPLKPPIRIVIRAGTWQAAKTRVREQIEQLGLLGRTFAVEEVHFIE